MAQPKVVTINQKDLNDAVREYVKDCDYSSYDDLSNQIDTVIRKEKRFIDQAVTAHARTLARNYGGRIPRQSMAREYDVAGLIELSSEHAKNLFDQRLGWSNGMRLGDAVRDDVIREAEGHKMQALGAMRQNRWYTLIAKAMSPDTSVEQQFQEAELRELLNRAKTETTQSNS